MIEIQIPPEVGDAEPALPEDAAEQILPVENGSRREVQRRGRRHAIIEPARLATRALIANLQSGQAKRLRIDASEPRRRIHGFFGRDAAFVSSSAFSGSALSDLSGLSGLTTSPS